MGDAKDCENFLGADGCILRLSQLRQQDHKFVAALPADGIGMADASGQSPCDGLQQAIADGVTQGIIDGLESIDIQI